MFKVILLALVTVSATTSMAQTITGHYRALELNDLSIDSMGNIRFYGIDSFPKEKWYHEVNVTIKGNEITIDKSPVWFKDSLKSYSASDGGFITYSGKLTKVGEAYYVQAKMINYDYIGLSFFDRPKIDEETGKAYTQIDTCKVNKRFANYDRIKKNGNYVYFRKGLLRQDYLITPDKDGISINNVFYRRQE